MSIITEVNIETGEEITRPMTPKELKEWQEGIDAAEKRKKIRESALAKLAALGLTEDEIAAL